MSGVVGGPAPPLRMVSQSACNRRVVLYVRWKTGERNFVGNGPANGEDVSCHIVHLVEVVDGAAVPAARHSVLAHGCNRRSFRIAFHFDTVRRLRTTNYVRT